MKSLLETAYALQQHLHHALPPHPQLPHPLALESTNPLESIAQLRQHVQQTILQLGHGVAHFPTAASDRYLIQLKDAAASEAALLALRDYPRRKRTRNVYSRDQERRDRHYKVTTPTRRHRGDGWSTLQVLEQIASELNLVTFRDHEDDDEDDDNATPVTLSLGGKLMVVDVTASSAQSHHIQRVKVAYVVKGLDKQSTFAATKLEHLFATSDDGDDDEKEDEEREEREQTRWKGIRRILRELKDLDEMADRTGRDAFQELEQLNANLETAFLFKKKDDISEPEPVGSSAAAAADAADAASIPPMDRLLLQPPDSLYSIVIYHATPFAQLGTHWARLVSSSSSLSRFEIMEALRGEGDNPAAAAVGQRQAGIYAVQLELGPLHPVPEPEFRQSPPPKTTTAAAKDDDDHHHHRPESSSLFLARLIPNEVPIHPETGRAVLKALGFGFGYGSGSGKNNGAGADAGASAGAGSRSLDEEEEDDAAKEEAAMAGAGGERTGRRTRTTLAWMRAVTLLRGGSGGQSVMQNDDREGVTYEQALAPSTTTCRPLLLRYQLPTTFPSASSPSSSAHNTTASLSSSGGGYGYGLEASYLAFRSVPHLVAALEILARQTRLNELLRSIVDGRYGSVVVVGVAAARAPSPPGHDHGHGHGQGEADKDRVEMMSLDELFAPPSADTPLVVPISVGTGTGTSIGPLTSSSSSSSVAASPPPPPIFSLTFPFPALKAAPTDLLGLPLSLQFSLPLPVVTDNTLSSSLSSASSWFAAEELVTTKFVAPDEVVRSLLGGEEARRELEGRVGRVVHETGVVGFAVEEVVRTLRRAIAKVVDHPE